MNKIRLYVDTSVFGGYFDNEFKENTKLLFERIKKNDFDIYISEISKNELIHAPFRVRNIVQEIPVNCLFNLEFTEEVKELANHYIREKILGKASLNDAYHIAITTINRIDVLVSWNFTHIVNFNKIRLFNSVNLKQGYPAIDIRTPIELINYENQNKK